MENICFLDSTDKVGAIRSIIRSCPAFSSLPDPESFMSSVLEREASGSTDVGHGVLASHGQIPNLKSVHAGLGVIPAGITVEHGTTINLIFVFASDPERYDLYVSKLSALLGCVHDLHTRKALLEGRFEYSGVQRICGILNPSLGKKEARHKALSMLRSASFPSRETVVDAVCATPCFIDSDDILAFCPLSTEVDVSGVISNALDLGKRVWLPVCLGQHEMKFARISGSCWRDGLIRSGNGTFCPVNCDFLDISSVESACILIPGLAFDSFNHRLGRGGGFYDSFLSSIQANEHFFRIGICIEAQMGIWFPIEAHDQTLDDVIVIHSAKNTK
jgi:5-formyltetrahydrofolate cyclo-ligase